MARKSKIEEGVVYKLFWELLTNSISFLTIFLPVLLLLQMQFGTGLGQAMLLFCLGVFICMLLSLTKSPVLQFIGNLVPVLLLLYTVLANTGLQQQGDEQLRRTLQILVFDLTIYSFSNGALKEAFDQNNSIWRATAFLFLQMNKIAMIIACTYLITSITSQNLTMILPGSPVSVTQQPNIFYLLLNLAVLVLELVSALTMLFFRAAALEKISWRLKRMSGWSFDDTVIEKHLIREGNNLNISTRTVMFGDIRGFTAYAESKQIQDTLKILSDFYQFVEMNVAHHNGYKPEFIADEFITFFDDTDDAVKCALSICTQANAYLAQYDLGLGLGMNRGKVLEGIIGGKDSKKYTVMGRVVNMASRLQAQALKGQILITKAVSENIKEVIPHVEKIADTKLKGVTGNIEILNLKGFLEKEKYPSLKERIKDFIKS